MEVLRIRARGGVAARRALEVLNNGGIMIFPTDTVYGIGGDAFGQAVARRVRRLKGRPSSKPFPWLVADLAMAKRYARFTPEAEQFARGVWPGATTLVLPARRLSAKTGVEGVGETIGLRVPAYPWLQRLIKRFGRPLIGTSANRSGQEPVTTAREAAETFPNVDLVIDGGKCAAAPSRVVDIVSGRVLRPR